MLRENSVATLVLVLFLAGMVLVGTTAQTGCINPPPPAEGEGEGEVVEGEGEGEVIEGEGEGEVTYRNDGVKEGYVGSSTCGNCHGAIYDAFILSGHPYKVNKVMDNMPPEYPYAFPGTTNPNPGNYVENVPLPPMDFDGSQIGWDEVSYVIGGYGWKARFMDLEGYILTQTDDVDADGRTRSTQWNPPTPLLSTTEERWVPYSHPSDDQIGNARKPYNCGKCHTTGWTDAVDDFAFDNGVVLVGILYQLPSRELISAAFRKDELAVAVLDAFEIDQNLIT